MPSEHTTYRFGPYELQTSVRELAKHGVKVRLRPQPFQVLRVLLKHAGEVVTREQLRNELWPSDTFVDFEHGLNTAIKELRGVLSDSASEPRYIETLPKLGYRIVVPVESAAFVPPPNQNLVQTEAVFPENAVNVSQSPHHQQRWSTRRWAAVAAIAVVLAAGLGAYVQWSRSRARLGRPGDRVMLAVLPFENLTGDASQDYFSDGLTEEMIAQLGRLDPQHLGVIARTSVMRYKHTQEPVSQIGQELGVQYVLEGSVRRDSNNVRISAQLIETKNQTHVWSRQYDREPGGVLSLETEIGREAADEIQMTLGEKPRGTKAAPQAGSSPTSYEAYDFYLKGRYFWNKRTREGFQEAADQFQKAIAKDPNYASAYAGLADTYGLMSTWQMAPQREFMPKARTTALRAMALDETLAEAHTSLALVAEAYDYDWQTAEKEFRLAIQLNPSYATAHQWYAECLSWQGRFAEALAESERARQLDPLSVVIARDHGVILYYSRQYDRAIKQFLALRDMDPSFPFPGGLFGAYVQEGKFREALSDLTNSGVALGETPNISAIWVAGHSAYVYGRSGQQAQARQELAGLEQLVRHSQVDMTLLTLPRLLAYLGTGQKDDAIRLLQKATAEHSNVVLAIKVDPIYDPLRDDPRFQDLLRRVGLAQ